MAGTYRVITLGCKVNQYESQQLRRVLEQAGWRPAAPGEEPALTVVNTCAVTADASRKSHQAVRRALRAGGGVIVTGCEATARPEALARLPGVALVLTHGSPGPARLHQWVSARQQPEPRAPRRPAADPFRRGARVSLPVLDAEQPCGAQPPGPHREGLGTDHSPPDPTLPMAPVNDADFAVSIEEFEGHQRAFVKVQDGCDAWCTYCIIPRLRRRVVWKPLDVVVREVESLVAHGHREIVLTGIFLGAWGQETALRRRWVADRPRLSDLVRAVARVPGVGRVRLSSLEPGDVSDDLLEVLASEAACVPHLHLPLQSGSPAILRRMNRQYTREEFDRTVERVRAALDRPAITTDIVVGFPGETEADFEQTLEAARAAGFSRIHGFPYSPRSGTVAARWRERFVSGQRIRERMGELRRVATDLSLAFRRQFVGETERVLVEAVVGRGDAGRRVLCRGYTDRYFEAVFEGPPAMEGQMVPVRIERVTPRRTHAVALEPLEEATPPGTRCADSREEAA